MLALVEGWVDEVVGQATESRMPAAGRLQEAVRRRRAAGGPAEQTSPRSSGSSCGRRLRDASTLWGALRREGHPGPRRGVGPPRPAARPADLDDPLGFREGVAEPEALTDAEFDAALADLLDGNAGPGPDEGPAGDDDPGHPGPDPER